MKERRKLERKYLMFYSRVFNRASGRLIGHLVDITPEGAMLISEEPIKTDTVYRLQMELPDGLTDKQFLVFEARSVWCQQDIDPNFFNTGFQLLDMTAEDIEIIEHMVQEYKLRGH